MTYNRNVFSFQHGHVRHFVRHLTYCRTIGAVLRSNNVNSEFWAATSDAHLKIAIVRWCIVFGSWSNETHWTNIAFQEPPDWQAEFRTRIYEATGLREDAWNAYCEDLRNFRNNYIAHQPLEDYSDPVPNLDNALIAAFTWDDWVHEKLGFEASALLQFRDEQQMVAEDVEPHLTRAVSEFQASVRETHISHSEFP